MKPDHHHHHQQQQHHQLSKCNTCDSQHRFLHNVRHPGSFLRLCSPCVLKSHPDLFCPNCLQLHSEDPIDDLIKCLKCSSIAHSTCVPSDFISRYLCPSCSKPGFSFSDSSNKKAKLGNGESIRREVFDISSAKVLLAAARIANRSMNRAAAIARVEAEKRVKEAAFARKKAREAIENVHSIAVREREKECFDSVPLAEHKKKLKESQKRMISNNVGVEGKGKVKGSSVLGSAKPQIRNDFNKGDDEKEKMAIGFFSRSVSDCGQLQLVQNHGGGEEREKNKAFTGSIMQQQQQNHIGEQRGMLKRYVDSELQNHVDALKQLRVEDDGSIVSVPSLT